MKAIPITKSESVASMWYNEGYKAGAAERDRLREALEECVDAIERYNDGWQTEPAARQRALNIAGEALKGDSDDSV